MPSDLDAPDDVIGAAAKIFGDVAARDFLQGVVIQAVQPVVRDEAQNQVAHQLRGGEQEFVAAVVIGCHGCDLIVCMCGLGIRSPANDGRAACRALL